MKNTNIKILLEQQNEKLDSIHEETAKLVAAELRNLLKDKKFNKKISLDWGMGCCDLLINGKPMRKTKTFHKGPLFESWKLVASISIYLDTVAGEDWAHYLEGLVIYESIQR